MLNWRRDASGGEGASTGAVLPWQITFALFAGIIVLAAYSCTTANGVKVFGILFILSGAAFLIGSLIGFLFGIPKSRTDGSSKLSEDRPLAGGSLREKYWDNANLEEVSDWLTKIIVGLGLVEFTRLVDFFAGIGTISEPVLGSDGKLILQGALLYFLVLGFIFCYLWTRVVFYGILVDVDAIRQTVRQEVRQEVVRVENKRGEDFEINKKLNDLYVAIDVNKNKKPEERDWGVLNKLGEEVKEIFKQDPLNRKAAILTARFISEIENDPATPLGNEQAIARLDEYLDAKRKLKQFDKDYADVLYNRAGHGALVLASLSGDEERMARVRMQALKDFAESVKLSPANAKEAAADSDFAALNNDAEFKRIAAEAAASHGEAK